jgi:tRNA/tmRNA/rRNA uracil-C5-methylase (TrmA/RlmC/RlmD family)
VRERPGIDSLIAAKKAAPEGEVIGVDMTPAMLEKARRARREAGLSNVDFRHGRAEELPVSDGGPRPPAIRARWQSKSDRSSRRRAL